MKDKILFITFNDLKNKTGGSQCSHRNFTLLQEKYNVDLYLVRSSFFSKLFGLFYFYFPPFSLKNKKEINAILLSNEYKFIFFDHSLFGVFVRYVKEKYNIKVVTFFHNVEYDYINVRLLSKNLIRFLYRIIARYNELKTVQYSDIIIALNARDEQRIFQLYNRKSDFIFPITFNDSISDVILNRKRNLKSGCLALFVGSYGRANYDGIKWFVDNVIDELNIHLYIVGLGFENRKKDLEKKNVVVVGTVDDITEYYVKADLVISPIFIGGGMKVKIGEALMYGCNIYGTKEAFEGYDSLNYDKVGGICENKEEFILKIEEFLMKKRTNFNSYSRDIFLNNYSTSSLENSFWSLINKL